MYKCHLKNLTTDEVFVKVFSSPFLMEKFLKKCKYSKKIKCIGVTKEWE